MKKRKICVVINNRANYARIKSALIAIKKNKKLELQIVLGSSAILDRYGSVFTFWRGFYDTHLSFLDYFNIYSIKKF